MTEQVGKLKRNHKTFLIIGLSVFVVGFLVNFIWEVLQSPLYTCSSLSVIQFLPILLGSTFGDAVIMLGLYAVGYIKTRNLRWIFNIKKEEYALIAILGFLVAIFIELANVGILERWAYTDFMPVLPFINVGLVPVIQLMLLPFIVFWIVKKMYE